MKKYFITFLCASLAIPVIAGVPRLSRNDIGHVTMIENPVLDASTMTDANLSPSLSQFMRERHLTLNDNRLRNRSPRNLSIEELEGARIASLYAFNFDWDNDSQIAIINDSSYAIKGQCCEITCSSSTENEFILSGFYDDTKIPISINIITGLVTIKAGIPLDTITDTIVSDPIRHNTLNLQHFCRTRTIYAMPLSWLTGGDDYYDIHGQVEEDGSITLEDFAFLVKEKVQGIESWGLSPIFMYITLLRPNGSHSCTFSQPNADQWGYGHGGLVPRKPGTSKPISSPRPFVPMNSMIGDVKPIIDFNSAIGSDHIIHFSQLYKDKFPVLPDGYGGLVPRKPGSAKPISLLPYDYLIGSGKPNNFNSVIGTGNGGFNPDSLNPGSIDPEYELTYMKVPVYVKTINEGTLIVYNLFGLSNACVIKIGLDGMMDILPQEVYNDGLGKVYYIDWNTGYCTGNWKKTVSWSQTKIYDEYGNDQDRKFTNNKLYFTDSVPPQPGIIDYVMATKVGFKVLTHHTPSVTVLYSYDLETGDSCVVTNPVSFPREDKPYKVCLAAKTYDLDTYMYSEMTRLEYEIPALDGAIIRGDVNNDRVVNISDVTSMIDGLLTDNWDGKNYNNADCNLDDEVNISDVTTLIDYLLMGTWAK